MPDDRFIDLDRYLRSRVRVVNDGGGRGYDSGLRAFDCPLCGDARARGWVGVEGWGAGCFNIGCVAEPQLAGGVVEWVRRVEGLQTRADAWRFLRGGFGVDARPPSHRAVIESGPDFCRFPPEMRAFSLPGGAPPPMERLFVDFIKSQWGLSPAHARSWGLGWCLYGRYAWRVVIPVVMDGQPVAFQARTIRDGHGVQEWPAVGAKYLTASNVASTRGPAECGRPASRLLFNAGALVPGGEGIVVEGAGDVMRWHRDDRARQPAAVALLGVALTPEKAAMIHAARLERVIVALDAEPEAERRARRHVSDLRDAWHVNAVMGRWRGGKDSGSGATLEIESA